MIQTARLPAPVQDRSIATCDRIVAATRRLLATTRFEDIPVKAIASRARASISSFYNLFRDKDALLAEIYRRHCQEIIARLQAFCRPENHVGRSLREIVSSLVRELVALHRSEHGLLRTLVLRSHSRPRSAHARPRSQMDEVLPTLARLIASRRREIRHPRPVAAAGLALLMALATLRESILFPETTAHVLGLTDRSLEAEVARALLGYLEAREAPA